MQRTYIVRIQDQQSRSWRVVVVKGANGPIEALGATEWKKGEEMKIETLPKKDEGKPLCGVDRIIQLALAVLFTLALSACTVGTESDPNPTAPQAPPSPVQDAGPSCDFCAVLGVMVAVDCPEVASVDRCFAPNESFVFTLQTGEKVSSSCPFLTGPPDWCGRKVCKAWTTCTDGGAP